MSGPMFFVRECPVCGRRLQIRVTDLGKRVGCRHCRGTFDAVDNDSLTAAHESSSLLDRAEELLATAEERIQRPR